MPRPYVLQVHSHPIHTDPSVWRQWYTEEHIRDMVHFGASKTGACYESSSKVIISGKFHSDGNDSKDFFALYQSNRKHCLDYAEYKDHVRLTSRLFDDGATCHQVGAFTPTDLLLVEVLGSYEYNESVPPHIVQVKLVGPDVEAKLQHEHVNALSSLAGYRRTLLYRPLEPTRYGADDIGPYVVFLHEFDEGVSSDDLESVKGYLQDIEATRDCAFTLRSFRLIDSEGFDGKCRRPERLDESAK